MDFRLVLLLLFETFLTFNNIEETAAWTKLTTVPNNAAQSSANIPVQSSMAVTQSNSLVSPVYLQGSQQPPVNQPKGSQQPTTIPGQLGVGSQQPPLNQPQGSQQPTTIPVQGSQQPTTIPAQGSQQPPLNQPQGSQQPAILPEQGSQQPTVIPAQGSQQPAILPAQGSQQPTVIPAQGSQQPAILPAQGSQQPTILPAQGSQQPTILPAQGSQQPTIIPAQGSQQPTILPRQGSQQYSVLPGQGSQQPPGLPAQATTNLQPANSNGLPMGSSVNTIPSNTPLNTFPTTTVSTTNAVQYCQLTFATSYNSAVINGDNQLISRSNIVGQIATLCRTTTDRISGVSLQPNPSGMLVLRFDIQPGHPLTSTLALQNFINNLETARFYATETTNVIVLLNLPAGIYWTDAGPCPTSSCANQGVCNVTLTGAYYCSCTADYSGYLCQSTSGAPVNLYGLIALLALLVPIIIIVLLVVHVVRIRREKRELKKAFDLRGIKTGDSLTSSPSTISVGTERGIRNQVYDTKGKSFAVAFTDNAFGTMRSSNEDKKSIVF